MGEPVVGYRVEQVMGIVLFGIVTMLYSVQALAICCGRTSTDKKFTIRWAAHRIGPISSLLLALRFIDGRSVFGIYTDESRTSLFLVSNGSSLIAVLAFSMIYSVIMSNSATAQIPIPKYLSRGLMTLAVTMMVTANVAPALAKGLDDRRYEEIWILYGAFCCFSCLVLLVASAVPLRRKLQENVRNTRALLSEDSDQMKSLKASMRSLDRTLLFSLVVILAAGISTVITGVTAFDQPQRAPVNPDSYSFTAALIMIFLWIGLVVVLHAVWLPVHCASKGACGCWLVFRSSSRHSGGSPSPATGTRTLPGNRTPSGGKRQMGGSREPSTAGGHSTLINMGTMVADGGVGSDGVGHRSTSVELQAVMKPVLEDDAEEPDAPSKADSTSAAPSTVVVHAGSAGSASAAADRERDEPSLKDNDVSVNDPLQDAPTVLTS